MKISFLNVILLQQRISLIKSLAMNCPIYPTSITESGFLPIRNVDVEWATEEEMAKRTFKREVLSKIEKLRRTCGVDKDGKLCAACYFHEEVCFHHEELFEVDFEDFKKKGNSWLLVAYPDLDVFDFKAFSPVFYFEVLIKHWVHIRDVFSWGSESAE